MKPFKPVDESLFFSRNDVNDQRLGDLVRAADVSDLPKPKGNSFVLGGYPDDAGIKINGGRLGASHGPDVIRKYLYKMTPSYLASESADSLYDIGNLNLNAELEDRHTVAKTSAK